MTWHRISIRSPSKRLTAAAAGDPENHAPTIVTQPVTAYSPPLSSGTGKAITLNATVRDFLDGHPDFEDSISGLLTGLVHTQLGSDGNPVFAGPNGRGAITSSEI